jgi:hypothetical protein
MHFSIYPALDGFQTQQFNETLYTCPLIHSPHLNYRAAINLHLFIFIYCLSIPIKLHGLLLFPIRNNFGRSIKTINLSNYSQNAMHNIHYSYVVEIHKCMHICGLVGLNSI